MMARRISWRGWLWRGWVLWGVLAGLVTAAALIGAFVLGMLFGGHTVINQYRTTNNYKTVYVTKTVTVDKSVHTSTTNNYVTNQTAPVNVTVVVVNDNGKQPVKERKHCKIHTSKSQGDYYSRTKRMRLPSYTDRLSMMKHHRHQYQARISTDHRRGTYGLKFARP